MVELAAHDYVPLDRFPLVWRWTEPERITPMVVPESALEAIRPLTPEAAARVANYADNLLARPRRDAFEEVDGFDVGRIGRQSLAAEAEVRDWLTGHLGSDTGALVISWSTAWAARTDIPTFLALWPTFCYPVEDIIIWPDHERWMLLFDYKQRFYLERVR